MLIDYANLLNQDNKFRGNKVIIFIWGDRFELSKIGLRIR